MTGIDVVEETATKISKSAHNPELDILRAALEEIRAQLASLTERVAGLERRDGPAVEPTIEAVDPLPTTAASAGDVSVAAASGITEEEVLAISAALAAWLGVQPHIRQIRLIRSSGWAQQGRVTIQTSHGLH
jgi:methylmalonyl-CoA carboxyltransferase large subunit